MYINRPEPITFMPVAVDTSGGIYDDFSHLLFLHAHREDSALTNELSEESDQFRFLRAACLANIKGSVGLTLAKTSDMRISIPLDLSSRSFIPLPCFIRSRRSTPLLVPSLVFSPRRGVLPKRHMRGSLYVRSIGFFLLEKTKALFIRKPFSPQDQVRCGHLIK
jgi:hypothetical protein